VPPARSAENNSASEHAVLTGAYAELEQLLALRHKPFAKPPSATSRVVGNQAGLKLSKIKGRGVDFSEVRAYQPGDDIRSIDWRVTARKNKPHTKIFREERERPTLVVVDQSQNMFFGSKLRLKSVTAAELAARIAWQNLAVGDRVGGVVIGNEGQNVHRPYRTTKSVARFLNDVALFNQKLGRSQIDASASVHEGMMRVRRLTHTNYRIFVLSDFSGDLTVWREHLHQLARHNQVVVVHIHDPLEEHLPPADHYVVTDGVDRLQFYTGDRSLRQRYAKRFHDHTDALMALCAHEAMRYISVQTKDDHLDQLAWV
jgi:uncharacterized protein (DUF58 family)